MLAHPPCTVKFQGVDRRTEQLDVPHDLHSRLARVVVPQVLAGLAEDNLDLSRSRPASRAPEYLGHSVQIGRQHRGARARCQKAYALLGIEHIGALASRSFREHYQHVALFERAHRGTYRSGVCVAAPHGERAQTGDERAKGAAEKGVLRHVPGRAGDRAAEVDRIQVAGVVRGYQQGPGRRNVVEVVEKRKLPSHELRVSEAELLSNKIPDGAAVIVFDEKGKEIDSRGLAQLFGDWRDEGRSTTALVIGGADGVDEQLIKRADRVVSLGRMTWPHMLVRGLVAEQLYRAQSILAGHPYHREG